MNRTNSTFARATNLHIESIYAVIFMFGLMNFLVIFAVIRNRKMHSVTNIYIVNLSIADAAMIGTIPFLLYYLHCGDWVFGLAICKLYWILEQTNKYASVLFLTILSVDRYLAICRPMQSLKYRTKGIAFAVVASVYLVVSALLTPVYMYARLNPWGQCVILWAANENVTRGDNSGKETETHFFFFTVFFVFVMPVSVMMFYYALIIKKLVKLTTKAVKLHGSRRASERLQSRPPSLSGHAGIQQCDSEKRLKPRRDDAPQLPKKESSEKHYRHITRMIFVVIICHVICWTPVWVVNFMMFAEISVPPNHRVIFKYCHMLPYVNSALNPLLYGATNSHYRNTFKGLLCCCRFGRDVYKTGRRWSNSMLDANRFERSHPGRRSFVQESLANVIMELQMIVAAPGRHDNKKEEAEIIYHSVMTGDTQL